MLTNFQKNQYIYLRSILLPRTEVKMNILAIAIAAIASALIASSVLMGTSSSAYASAIMKFKQHKDNPTQIPLNSSDTAETSNTNDSSSNRR